MNQSFYRDIVRGGRIVLEVGKTGIFSQGVQEVRAGRLIVWQGELRSPPYVDSNIYLRLPNSLR